MHGCVCTMGMWLIQEVLSYLTICLSLGQMTPGLIWIEWAVVPTAHLMNNIQKGVWGKGRRAKATAGQGIQTCGLVDQGASIESKDNCLAFNQTVFDLWHPIQYPDKNPEPGVGPEHYQLGPQNLTRCVVWLRGAFCTISFEWVRSFLN